MKESKIKIVSAVFVLLISLILTKSASAATESIAIIRPDCANKSISTANCYTSLTSWEAAEQKDLVQADEISVAQIEGNWTSADTSAVYISGWTTDATHYIKIFTTSEARHLGIWSDSKYRLESSATVFSVAEENVRIEGLQIKQNDDSNSSRYAIKLSPTAQSNFYLAGNIIKGNSDTTGFFSHGIGTTIGYAGSFVYIWNNIIYDFNSNGTGAGIDIGSNHTAYIYNNTINNCYLGIRHTITAYAKNNIVQNTAGDSYSGSTIFDTSSDYNISDDDTSTGGVNDKINQTVSFVSTTTDTENFHLQSGDSSAKDAGTDLSADAVIAVTTDIDRGVRSGIWDIGADEQGTVVAYACDDGMDNDGDGKIDYPADIGCSSSTDSDEYNDITAPSAISDLAISSCDSTECIISWTAPGDDSTTGTATSYDLRYSTSDITSDADFNSASLVTGEPNPSVAGTLETETVTGLQSGTRYYFALKTADEVPNISSISNVPSELTSSIDSTPASLSNGSPSGTLTAGTTSTTISVSSNESATCKYATTSGVVYSSMINVFSTTGGTTHSSVITDLGDDTTYNYYIRCSDANGNVNTTDFTISFSVAEESTPVCTSFAYSEWGDCQSDNTKTRTVISTEPSICVDGNPITSNTCVYEQVIDVETVEEEEKTEVEDVFTVESIASKVSSPHIKIYNYLKEKIKSDETFYAKDKKFSFRGEDSVLAGGTVKLYKGSKLEDEDIVDEDGNWKVRIKEKKNGTNTYKIKYYNEGGDKIKSKEYKISIDLDDPEFTDLPSELSKKSGDEIWWKAKDNKELDEFKVYFNGNKYKINAPKNGKDEEIKSTFTIPKNTPNGRYDVQVRAYDKAGNREIKYITILIK